jgi:hypothetical protein
MNVEQSVDCLAGKTEVFGENLPPVPLCPPQIPNDLTGTRTRGAAVGSQRLTTELRHGQPVLPELRTLQLVQLLRLKGCLWIRHMGDWRCSSSLLDLGAGRRPMVRFMPRPLYSP